jgi:thiamine pyrophosphate-dependent acetolactate synthase large subunit-like protein
MNGQCLLDLSDTASLAAINQEKHEVEAIYGGQTPGSDERWLFPDADFARSAESMGAWGITLHQPGDLASALAQAFAAGKPTLVDVKTHLDGIAPARGRRQEGDGPYRRC